MLNMAKPIDDCRRPVCAGMSDRVYGHGPMSGFDEDEQPALPALIDRSVEMIQSFVSAGVERTMTRFNKTEKDVN